MREDGIVVRVVEAREVRWVGFLVALAGGLALAAIASHSWMPHHVFGVSKYWSFGLASFVWSLGTLITWRRRPRVARAHVEHTRMRFQTYVLRLDGELVLGSNIVGVKLARAEQGCSIAIGGRSSGGLFLEVERKSDAHDLVTALEERRGDERAAEACTFAVRGDVLRWGSWILGGLGAACGLAYAVAVGGFGASEVKGLFGLSTVLFGFAASVLFLATPLLTSKLRVGEHTLHESSALADHFRLHALGGVGARDTTGDARIDILDRGREATAAWIARLDAITGDEGYRGGALGTDDLRHIAEDAAAPPAARLGALRVLARRPGGLSDALRVRVADDLGRRVRVVTDAAASVDSVAEELDALGPAFRARARPR